MAGKLLNDYMPRYNDICAMLKHLLLSTLLCASTYSWAQTTFEKKTLEVSELNDNEMIINGVLDEVQWTKASMIDELNQFFPEAAPPENGVSSDVRLFYTQKGIYISAHFSDERSPILSQITPRDRVNANTDWLQLTINPFNDGANDFIFYLSAAGVQGDARATNGGNEDGNWNAVWNSAVIKKEHSWTAEIFIPYRVLRIPQTLEGEQPKPWGFNIKRQIRSDRTSYSWNPIDRNFNNESLQSGLLTGIVVKNPPLRVSLRPNITATSQKAAGKDIRNYATGGADVKIGLNKSFTLDMTLLPDFSQVAFDEQFVNFEAFERQFDENRQFFTEGVNLFNKAGLFYSRRIGGNPKNFTNANLDDLSNTTQSFTRMLNATKLTGTTDKNLSVGMLNALTAANYISGTDSLGNPVQILTEPLTNYNVVAVDQRIGGNNSVGLINTNVLRTNAQGQARDATVTAVTANLNLFKNTHFADFDFSHSSVYDIDEPYTGNALNWGVGKQTGAWRWNHTMSLVTPNFDPNDMGFQRRGNRIHQLLLFSHQIQEPRNKLLRRRHQLGFKYNRLYTPNSFERFHVEYSYFALTQSFLAWGYNAEVRPAEYDYYDPRVWGRYRINPASVWHNAWVSTDFRKPLAFELRGGQWAWADYGARGLYGTLEVIARVNDHFNFRSELNLSSNHQIGWAQTLSTDSIGMALRNRRNVGQSISGQYLFGPNSYISLDLRHTWNRFDNQALYHLEQNGTLSPSTAYTDPNLSINFFNVDLKYVLWFAPGRELNLLYRASLANSDHQTNIDYWKNMQNVGGIPADHLFSLRVVYFLDYAEIVN